MNFESVECIFNERGRFSALATAMTLNLNLDSRTRQKMRHKLELWSCCFFFFFAEIYIPAVLLKGGTT